MQQPRAPERHQSLCLQMLAHNGHQLDVTQMPLCLRIEPWHRTPHSHESPYPLEEQHQRSTERETYKAHASHARFKIRQNCSVLSEVKGHYPGWSKGAGGRRAPRATWNLLCLDLGTSTPGPISL